MAVYFRETILFDDRKNFRGNVTTCKPSIKMAAIGRGQELRMMREVALVAYAVGLEAERSGLLEKLKKKRKYRKLMRGLRALVGLAHNEAGLVELMRHRMKLDEATRHKSGR